MHFFYATDIKEGRIAFDPLECQHLSRSLRKKIGDPIHVLDGEGVIYRAKITRIDPKYVEAQVLERHFQKKSAWALSLAVAPTKKSDKMEWMVEKCTELGVGKITFIACQRSERRKLNLGRLHKIAVSAMKQSGRVYLPILEDLTSMNQYMKQIRSADNKFIAHCGEGLKADLTTLPAAVPSVIVIGPEGDFTPEEIIQARQANFKEITLGKCRLRTETAAVHVTSVVNFLNQ